MTDSRSSDGWKMVPSICESCGLSFQLSLAVINEPFGPCSSIIGSFRTSAAGTPKPIKERPRPRKTTGFDALPVMINPPIMALSPTSTRRRVEIFKAWAGVGVAVGVAVAVAVGLAVAVAVGVTVAVGVAVGVAVAV